MLTYGLILAMILIIIAEPSLFLLFLMISSCIILLITHLGINKNSAPKECINPFLNRSGLERMQDWIIKRSQSRNVVAVSRMKHPHCARIVVHSQQSAAQHLVMCKLHTKKKYIQQVNPDQKLRSNRINPGMLATASRGRTDFWAKTLEKKNLGFTILFPALPWQLI